MAKDVLIHGSGALGLGQAPMLFGRMDDCPVTMGQRLGKCKKEMKPVGLAIRIFLFVTSSASQPAGRPCPNAYRRGAEDLPRAAEKRLQVFNA